MADKSASDCRSHWVQKNGTRKSVKILLAMSVILFHIFNVLVHVLYYVIRKIIVDVSHNLKNHNYDSI